MNKKTQKEIAAKLRKISTDKEFAKNFKYVVATLDESNCVKVNDITKTKKEASESKKNFPGSFIDQAENYKFITIEQFLR